MKRHLLLTVLCLVCAFMLCACGSTAPAATSAPVETSAPAESAAPEESAAPVESPEPEASAAPVATLPDAGLVPNTEPEDRADTSLFELAKGYVDKPLSELQEEIGEPISSTYVSSCLIPGGQDGELQYDGFVVSTVKDGSSETVLDVRAG